MINRLRRWWRGLPKLQRNAVAIGVPVVGAAAIINRRRGTPADDVEDVEAKAAALGGGIIGGGFGGAADLTGFVNAFGESIANIEERIDESEAAQAGQVAGLTGLLGTLRDQIAGLASGATGGTGATGATGATGSAGSSLPTTTTTTTSTPSGSSLLRVGSRGQAVSNLQRWLADHGFNPGPIDGIFGPKTKAAVVAFQSAAGITVDGIVGPQTRAAMSSFSTGTSSTRQTTTSRTGEELLVVGGRLIGTGGGVPVSQGLLAATVPAIRPAAAASRRARGDRERIAALVSVRAAQ